MTSTQIFKNEKIVKALFETFPDILTILDRDGKILDCNHHFLDMFGYTKEEAVGKFGPIDMVSEKDVPKAVSAFNQLLTDGIILNVRLDAMRKDKSIIPSIWSGAKLNDGIGNIEGYLITGKDLTEIQKLEFELKKEKDEKLILIGDMTARIAHDLRNPLTIIVNAISLLKIKLQSNPDEKISMYLDSIVRATERMRHQVDDVLDYVSSRPLYLSVYSIIDLVKLSLENVIIPKNVKITYSDIDDKILCDKNQMIVVFTNLILNSIQAIGNDAGTIDIDWKVSNDRIIFKFIDSGRGVSKEHIEKIFAPFFTTKQAGTGLGLVSCKKIIEQHNGTISISNNPTTFTISLPINSEIK